MSNQVGIFCPKCSTKITGQSQFCRACAFDLSETNTPSTAAPSPQTPQFTQSNSVELSKPPPEVSGNPMNKIHINRQAVENSNYAPINLPQINVAQEQTSINHTILEAPLKEVRDYFFLYIIGGVFLSFLLITGAVVWFISYVNASHASTNTIQTPSYAPSNTPYANTSIKKSAASWSNTTNSYQSTSEEALMTASNKSDAPVFSSSLVGREGRLTTNANLRSASNKNASSIGIHFQSAKVRISNVEFYDAADGVSTWYKVKVTEYGCDTQGNLGCGKNAQNDADEGWVNAKVVRLD